MGINEDVDYIADQLRHTTISGSSMKFWPPLPSNTRWHNAISRLLSLKHTFDVHIVGKRVAGEKLKAETTKV